MGQTDDLERVEVTSAAALEAWLAVHHGQAKSVWLVTWKKAVPEKYVDREAVLDALLAWGWIDGRRKVLDAARTMQLISPRKQQAWAQSYKDRVARLEAAGRMQPPGQAAVVAGKASGLWDFFADVDALVVPDDLHAALAVRQAAALWEASAPSYRRNVLRWIKLAKTAPTRAKRVEAAAEAAATEAKLPQM
ncbi:MAG: YdeI/OmpD-associated family protein [Pseudomonadota bacterium]